MLETHERLLAALAQAFPLQGIAIEMRLASRSFVTDQFADHAHPMPPTSQSPRACYAKAWAVESGSGLRALIVAGVDVDVALLALQAEQAGQAGQAKQPNREIVIALVVAGADALVLVVDRVLGKQRGRGKQCKGEQCNWQFAQSFLLLMRSRSNHCPPSPFLLFWPIHHLAARQPQLTPICRCGCDASGNGMILTWVNADD